MSECFILVLVYICHYFALVGCKVLWWVCLFVCVSVCLPACLSSRITWKLCGHTSPNFLCMLPVPVAWSSSDGVAVCYILPILRMTSCFHVMGPMVLDKIRLQSRLTSLTLPKSRMPSETSDNYSVLVEIITVRNCGKVCYLWLPFFLVVQLRPQFNQSEQLSDSQDGCQTNSQRCDDFLFIHSVIIFWMISFL